MVEVYLSLGSNKGDRIRFLSEALTRLQEYGVVSKTSNIYESEPWGFEADKNFYNIVVLFQTQLNPIDLLTEIKNIEFSLGRRKNNSDVYTSRNIDIDIIFYQDKVIDVPFLQVPHKYAHKRKFVLYPMAEINPYFVHPILNKNILQLIDLCQDNTRIKKISEKKLALV